MVSIKKHIIADIITRASIDMTSSLTIQEGIVLYDTVIGL